MLNLLFLIIPFQIPNHVAVKIALELKKLLVDNSLLDVYVVLDQILLFAFNELRYCTCITRIFSLEFLCKSVTRLLQ